MSEREDKKLNMRGGVGGREGGFYVQTSSKQHADCVRLLTCQYGPLESANPFFSHFYGGGEAESLHRKTAHNFSLQRSGKTNYVYDMHFRQIFCIQWEVDRKSQGDKI